MEREIKGELFNALCKRCGERRTCHGICVDMNNAMVKANEIKATAK
ncbi:MAG: hypothetical protein ACLT9M_06100 [Anaerobutyricum hallii]|jgi:hypothetical protein|nr:hypothetical protein [Roseburia faecis]DAE85232.1 MAG TPA: hypothetical protein [Caudoviricetes sp.]DAQ41340.1 MAG TPA: hypothetical protein [Caudoviricetes sp.]DAV43416.1 MAG TPA: hypothetical protein [Caudoviricetes sp.]